MWITLVPISIACSPFDPIDPRLPVLLPLTGIVDGSAGRLRPWRDGPTPTPKFAAPNGNKVVFKLYLGVINVLPYGARRHG